MVSKSVLDRGSGDTQYYSMRVAMQAWIHGDGCAHPETSFGGACCEICCQIAVKVLQKQQIWVNF